MAVNLYFDHNYNKSEQSLIEDLTIEAIKMHGMDVVYIPRSSISRDDILGEDIIAKFENSEMIEMYLETVDGFENQGDLLAKFGLQIKDNATFVVSKKRYEEVMIGSSRPYEGDLIYFPLSSSLFEINFVEHENPFYNLGKLHTYKLTCELFTYNNEEFNTGHVDIDRVEDDHSNDVILSINDNDIMEQEATNTVVDYTESNPFGEF
jgi:hypothetical protein